MSVQNLCSLQLHISAASCVNGPLPPFSFSINHNVQNSSAQTRNSFFLVTAYVIFPGLHVKCTMDSQVLEGRGGQVVYDSFCLCVSNLSGVLMLHHSWPTSSCTHSAAEHPLQQSCISPYFTAAQRGILHYYAIWAATKPGPPAGGALPLTQSKE